MPEQIFLHFAFVPIPHAHIISLVSISTDCVFTINLLHSLIEPFCRISNFKRLSLACCMEICCEYCGRLLWRLGQKQNISSLMSIAFNLRQKQHVVVEENDCRTLSDQSDPYLISSGNHFFFSIENTMRLFAISYY